MFLRKYKFVNNAFLSTEQRVLNVQRFFETRSIAGVKEAFKVCSKIVGTDSCFCNKSLRLHRFPEFLRQLVDIVTYVIVIDNKIWKKHGKGRKNEEENLGLGEPLT